MLLTLPFKNLGMLGNLSKLITPLIVFGGLLLIIGTQLAGSSLSN